LDTEKKPRKSYTREFKVEAVRLTTEGGVSVAQAARDLSVNENTLHNWRRQFREWGAGPNAVRQLSPRPRRFSGCGRSWREYGRSETS
jgi:transposase-like protein